MSEPRIYKLRDDLVIARRTFGESVKYIVKDPERLEYSTIDETAYGLISLCDGRRDLRALALAATERFPGMDWNPLNLLGFLETYRQAHFFEDRWDYNILLIERRRKSRMRSLRKALANPLEIHLPAWDPDRFFERIARPLSPLFTRPALLVYLAIIASAIWLSSTHADSFFLSFGELWAIPGKTFAGLVALWAMLLFTVVLHEVGHGLTCKHFGGSVHKIGFLLLYFNPCMFCDVTESYFFEDRRKKHAVTLAGGLVDLLTASVATFIWYFTSPELFVNQVAHRIAIFNGVTGIIVNYNPLMKYDGYFLLGDSLGIPNLRGDAFRFLGNRIRQLLGLPHEEELNTPRERRIFWIFGVCAIAYSVFVLWFVVSVVGHWLIGRLGAAGYLATAALLFIMTRGYLRKMIGFIRFYLLDKAGHFRRYRTPYIAAGLALLALIFALPFPRNVRGTFTFSPGSEWVIRAEEPGVIEAVHAGEGALMEAGVPLVTLRTEDVQLELQQARSRREAGEAARAAAQVARDPGEAAMQLAETGAAAALERYQTRRTERFARVAPHRGVVLTPHLDRRVGMACAAGDTLCTLGDLEALRAEALLDERDLGVVNLAAPVELRTHAAPGRLLHGAIERLAPLPSGGEVRRFYRVLIRVENEGQRLRPGLTGTVRFDAGRASLFRQLLEKLAAIFRIEFWV